MVSIPSIPTSPDLFCSSSLEKSVGIVLLYRKNQLQPPIPIKDAIVKFKYTSLTFTTITVNATKDPTGIIYRACIPTGRAVSVTAKKWGIDFGSGENVEHRVGSATLSNRGLSPYMFPAFEARTSIPCSSSPVNIGLSGIGSSPRITVSPLTIMGYTIGKGAIYNISINDKTILSGNMPDDGNLNLGFPQSEFIGIGSTATIKATISFGTCVFSGSRTLSIPSLPSLPKPSPCTGSFTASPPNFTSIISGIKSPLTTLTIPVKINTSTNAVIPINIKVDGRIVYNQITGFTGFDLIRIYTLAGISPGTSLPHTITIESAATSLCNIPPLTINIPSLKPQITIPGCSKIITTVGTLNHPTEITDFNSTFPIYIRGVKEICESDPTNPEFIKSVPKGTVGTITLGNLSSNFTLLYDGIAEFDLSKLINLLSIQPSVTPTPISTPIPIIAPSRPSQPSSFTLSAVQAWLPSGYTAEPAGFGGAESLKITRKDGTYFYANKMYQLVQNI